MNLTTSQAIVRYLQAQWSERDGDRRRLIPGIWGIFGHGNVIGLGLGTLFRFWSYRRFVFTGSTRTPVEDPATGVLDAR